MLFVSQLAALAFTAATLVSANTVTFLNQDDTTRKIIITPSAGHEEISSIEIQGNGEASVDFPQGWIGNAYSISEDKEDIPGMLAEITFQGWNDLTYFDVSAIVEPNDHEGVKEMYPASEHSAPTKSRYSGCKVFPCNTAYYQPDDIQTISTTETELIVTLGSYSGSEKRDVEEVKYFPRNYVLGKL